MEALRVTHYKDEDIHVEGEAIDGKYFLHLNVARYSHNVQKKIDSLFEMMKESAISSGGFDSFYAILPNKEYAQYMGGVHIRDIETGEGTQGVYQWVLHSATH